MRDISDREAGNDSRESARPDLPDGVEDAIFGPGFVFLLTKNGILKVPTAQTEEQLKETLKQIAQYHSVLAQELDNQVDELDSLLRLHNPLSVIAALWLANSVTDPETFKEYSHKGSDAFTEYVATLYLTRPFAIGSGRGVQPIDGISGPPKADAERNLLASRRSSFKDSRFWRRRRDPFL